MLKKLKTLGSKLGRSEQQLINGGGLSRNPFCHPAQCTVAQDCIDRFPGEPPELWSCVNSCCQQF
ncbi:hypothetical protein U6A24_03730 [Aquimarina gracilis]|uniref:Bacteriocin-like protein n=1 Tax=Aquimarina gracilis TaxID=874422 RepID=A0ABU5ZR57_9FLAO|nr:hypothetical protein [Aquimarina gracilis]MEB3344555.1 hypothetical protein [Aquimarina gracilis]